MEGSQNLVESKDIPPPTHTDYLLKFPWYIVTIVVLAGIL